MIAFLIFKCIAPVFPMHFKALQNTHEYGCPHHEYQRPTPLRARPHAHMPVQRPALILRQLTLIFEPTSESRRMADRG